MSKAANFMQLKFWHPSNYQNREKKYRAETEAIEKAKAEREAKKELAKNEAELEEQQLAGHASTKIDPSLSFMYAVPSKVRGSLRDGEEEGDGKETKEHAATQAFLRRFRACGGKLSNAAAAGLEDKDEEKQPDTGSTAEIDDSPEEAERAADTASPALPPAQEAMARLNEDPMRSMLAHDESSATRSSDPAFAKALVQARARARDLGLRGSDSPTDGGLGTTMAGADVSLKRNMRDKYGARETEDAESEGAEGANGAGGAAQPVRERRQHRRHSSSSGTKKRHSSSSSSKRRSRLKLKRSEVQTLLSLVPAPADQDMLLQRLDRADKRALIQQLADFEQGMALPGDAEEDSEEEPTKDAGRARGAAARSRSRSRSRSRRHRSSRRHRHRGEAR